MTQQIIHLINTAIGSWDGWYWYHSFNGVDLEGPGWVLDWDEYEAEIASSVGVDVAREARSYGETVQSAADEADDLMQEALQELLSGRTKEARDLAQRASSKSMEYGDGSDYAAALEALEELLSQEKE